MGSLWVFYSRLGNSEAVANKLVPIVFATICLRQQTNVAETIGTPYYNLSTSRKRFF